MHTKETRKRRPQPRPYVVAMVLGTALTAIAPAPVTGAECRETARYAVDSISRYCTICWRNAHLHPDCWADCTQEVFNRLLERISPDSWNQVLSGEGDERREFLRAIDAVKKRTQRSRKAVPQAVESVLDQRELHDSQVAEDREAVCQAAQNLLSPRQQRVLQMSFEGWSVQDIAQALKVPAERISDEKYKAIRKLRDRFAPEDQAARREALYSST